MENLLDNVPHKQHTSVTDNQIYPHFCLQASSDYSVFINFRRHPVYRKTLEHVSEKSGGYCLELISRDPEIYSHLDEFKKNDAYGNPITYEYPNIGKTSATTLRYVRILSDIKSYFGALDHLKICEVGVGYGGQCRVINSFYKPETYRLVDIKPALNLAQRYLDHFILHSIMSYKTMNELHPQEYDMVISNYAFTELPRTIQDVYLEKIITRCKKGYMIYNEMGPPSFNSYKQTELVELLPGAEIKKENPLTNRNNCVIVWGIADRYYLR